MHLCYLVLYATNNSGLKLISAVYNRLQITTRYSFISASTQYIIEHTGSVPMTRIFLLWNTGIQNGRCHKWQNL